MFNMKNEPGRGLLGDAPGQFRSHPDIMGQRTTNQMSGHNGVNLSALFSASHPPTPPNTPSPGSTPGTVGRAGIGLLGDAPPGVGPGGPSGLSGGPLGHNPVLRHFQNSPGQPIPPNNVPNMMNNNTQSPKIIQKQNKNTLAQQIKKLKEIKGRVIILNLTKPATDEQVLQIGKVFGDVKNYLNTQKNSNGKAWLEFYEHEMALLALERIGRQEIFHLNDPIEAGASTWKQIIRKDGRDLWKSSESGEHDGIRKRKLTTSNEVGLLGDCPFDEPPSKVRRNSGTSQLSYPSVKSEEFTPIATSSIVPNEKDSSDLSLPSLVAMALTSAKEIENGHPMSFSSDVLRNCLTESIELVSILGKINRDHVTDQK